MNFDEHQGFFCNHFQDLLFSDKIVSGDASDKADVYRDLLVQSSYASNNNIVSPDAAEILMSDFNEQYVNIVDSFKENEGLNNFAEGALLICRQNRNESAQWKSSLTTSNVLEMDFVQELVKKSQEFSQKCQNQKLPECFNKSNPEKISSIIEKTNQHLTSSSNQTRITDFNWKQNLNGTNHKDPYMKNESVFPKPTAFAVIGGGTSPSPVNPDSHIYSKRADHYDSNRFIEHPSSDFLSTDKINEKFYGNSINKPVFSKQNLSSHSGPGYQQDNSVLRISDEQAFHQRNKQKFGRFPTQDTDNESEKNSSKSNNFRTAREQLVVNNQKKYGKSGNNGSLTSSFSVNRKCLGTRRGLNSKFISPMHNRDQENYDGDSSSMKRSNGTNNEENEFVDERLKGIDPKIIEMIMNEIMDHGPGVNWNDIAGLEFAKKNIKEIVVWPMLRPDIFVGLRGPPKGLLLFGPPGTGKTLIGKCIASQSKSTFFSISASSLTSKWVGEGEKTVRALFAVARCHQPTVIFIDEIDSLLSQRSDNEHESSRRIKTEFLVQLDGATTESEERLLIIGATNRPHEIDEAARRRFVRRLYIPLPDANARKQIIHNLLTKQKHFLSPEELETICQRTEGYSGSDMNNLCREAALGPIRSLPFGDIENITAEDVRPIEFSDFDAALLQVKASVSSKDLEGYIVWNEMYGSGSSK